MASLESMGLSGTTFADNIRKLLASRLQSRHHAARMLREMAAKTESAELLSMIKAIDPAAVAAAVPPDGGAAPAEPSSAPGASAN
jgi:hypothetical protein